MLISFCTRSTWWLRHESKGLLTTYCTIGLWFVLERSQGGKGWGVRMNLEMAQPQQEADAHDDSQHNGSDTKGGYRQRGRRTGHSAAAAIS